MKLLEKYPIIMIIIGIFGISTSSILVKLSSAPSAITAFYRLLWTVILMSPAVLGKKSIRREIRNSSLKTVTLSAVSGIFLAVHFVLWFESLKFTSVASSTTIVCTEVIWVSIGYCLFLKGKISTKAIFSIALTVLGSVLIAFSDAASSNGIYGDLLALAAAIAVAVYMLLGRMLRSNTSTAVYTYIVYLSCALTLLFFCIFNGYKIFSYGHEAVIVGLLLAIFPTILGHSIFSWCLKYFSPSFVSASKLCEPVISALLALIIFKETPEFIMLAGGILILIGVFSYSRIESNK